MIFLLTIIFLIMMVFKLLTKGFVNLFSFGFNILYIVIILEIAGYSLFDVLGFFR